MIVSVGDNVLADPVDGDAGETIEFPLAVAVLAELLDEVAVGVEHLDAMVRRVRHDDRIVGAHGDAAGPRE